MGGIPAEAMTAYTEFMREQGVTRGLSLMTDEEMTWFPEPGLIDSGVLPVYTHVPMSRTNAKNEIMDALRNAEAANEKIVVHCCAGMHRTGTVLAAWLVERYGLS